MKKTILLILILMAGVMGYSQGTKSDTSAIKSQPKDSITALDIAKTKYLVSVIVNAYYQECYRDSIPITEFYGKPIASAWWREKGRYYWDVFEPLPNVKYLHRRMTAERLLEEFTLKLGQ